MTTSHFRLILLLPVLLLDCQTGRSEEQSGALSRKLTEAWLTRMPRLSRDRPVEETTYAKLRGDWIEEGRRIMGVSDSIVAILTDIDSELRPLAALLAGDLAGDKSLSALGKAFETDNTQLRLNALRSLSVLEDSPARIDVLESTLRLTYRPSADSEGSEPSGNALLRANIALILSKSSVDRGKQLLMQLISAERDPYVLESVGRLPIEKK